MSQGVADLLAECLSVSETGGADFDKRLGAHSQDEAALRDLAALAQELRQMPAPPPSAAFHSAGYRSLMTEIQQQSGWRWQLGCFFRSPMPLFAGRGQRMAPVWATLLAAVTLCVCLGTGGVVMAAEGALPGDPLYGVKTAVENMRLAVAPAEGDVSLHARFAERRLDEIEALVAADRLNEVSEAAAGYEEHVGQALRVLETVGDRDAGTHDELAAELVLTLARQSALLDLLAGEMPAQVAPVIQQAQSVSTEARNSIKLIHTEPDSDGKADKPTATPTPGPTVAEPTTSAPAATPMANTPQPEHPMRVPTETAGPASARPTPGDASPAPGGNPGGEVDPAPVRPHATPVASATDAVPSGSAAPSAAGTPAPPVKVPPVKEPPTGTRVAPLTPEGTPVGLAPANTPPAPQTPSDGSQGLPPASTPAPPPPPGSPGPDGAGDRPAPVGVPPPPG